MMLEPATHWSRVKQSTTEPLRSLHAEFNGHWKWSENSEQMLGKEIFSEQAEQIRP